MNVHLECLEYSDWMNRVIVSFMGFVSLSPKRANAFLIETDIIKWSWWWCR